MIKRLVMVAALTLALAGCQTAGGQKQSAGALLGAVGGALAGSHFGDGQGKLVAVAAGTVLGALIGSEVGQSLDRADRLAMSNATVDALENQKTGHATTWHNPDSDNSGSVTPTRTWKESSGMFCREYQQTITVGGRTEEGYGTACRQPDGSWKLVN